ncbi:hypothetical protein ARMGADRAFT_128925 [Armillaria gallica]|uniref:Uncharacterized protein n=1 Tax=Armillaria gallica TaxID=47427 RepID=A0A2H3DZ61_ARMGA|nr:hypothetical protein ARMGADRAFT_128925 [Armillaria gallica]
MSQVEVNLVRGLARYRYVSNPSTGDLTDSVLSKRARTSLSSQVVAGRLLISFPTNSLMKALSFRLVTVRVRCKKDVRWHEVGASAWSVHASQAEQIIPPPVYLLDDILLRVRPGAVIILSSSGPDIVLQYFNALVYLGRHQPLLAVTFAMFHLEAG